MTKADPRIQITHEYYDKALGCVVQGKSHRDRIMKERGLFEIGNEKEAMNKLETRGQQERKAKDRKVDEEAIRRLRYLENR